ncbi:hypothetical protein RI129_001434 [Pyrocoelia pectoralis]|uniref:DUF659 domain-containing protein n=1 Tax=Pyrocoelia pectoralis TaxID=417401 RepID=A0AAN7ZK03_9COLE
MVSCNITLNNLDAPQFKMFFEQYMKETVISFRTASRTYIPCLYEEMLQKIRDVISNHYIWFSVDEITDVKGRYTYSKDYLVAVKQLDKTNHLTASRFVNDTLSLLYVPNQVLSDKILYMVTDGAAYMIKAGANLKIFFPNLVHTTCLAHGHRIAEAVRVQFHLVNSLINNGKKVFLKAPSRIELYHEHITPLHEHLKDVPLPPQPVLTRWGTWIEAALFYCEHYKEFKNIVDGFDPSYTQSIADCQNVLKNRELIISHLCYIKTHFSDIPTII